jgi:hypothetical protein
MNKTMMVPMIGLLLLFAGCATPQQPIEPVVDMEESLTYLDAGIRPEVFLFPEYLLIEDLELRQHGRIPGTRLIGAELESLVGLDGVRNRYGDVLATQGWKTGKVELGRQFFRMLASGAEGQLEIRAVQGSAATQVFILFTPADEAATSRQETMR